MPKEERPYRRYLIAGLILAVLVVLALLFRDPLTVYAQRCYRLLIDRDQTQAFIRSFGHWAPLVFMVFQVGQVILAPIPGEATGFIGGYLFGAWQGFIYSSLALSLGSWINFKLGRLLGRGFIHRLIPAAQLARLNRYVRHQGALVVFLLFIFPGFPKDYLCLFLGITALPAKLFLIMASIGRMPGTLMLSLQGSMLFERMYSLLALLMVGCVLVLFLGYCWRERLYAWIEKMNNSESGPR